MRAHGRLTRQLVLIVTLPLPQLLKLAVLRRLKGWTVGTGVHIGLSYLDAQEVVLGDGSHIGHFNVVRNVMRFRMGTGAYLKNFNSFFGAGTGWQNWFPSDVDIGRNVAFMSHHFVDCTGTLVVGDGVTVGGRSTQIYTHQRNLCDNVASLDPTTVEIGPEAYIGACCLLVSCRIPARAVVGAGAVVVKDHRADGDQGPVLLAGNPARVMKRYPSTGNVGGD